MPNAGVPQVVDGRPHYPLTPDELTRWLVEFVENDGVSVVGGCCGTTPTFIDAARQAIESYNQEQIKRRRQPDNSPNLIVPGGYDHPIVLQLGLIGMDDGNRRPVNVAFLHPNGGVAAFMSGMTGSKGNMAQSVVEWNDERAVDQALAKGDLEEAKRLAFALAPVEQIKPEDAPRHWKPRKLTVPHLRARAKVFMAMKDWQAAYDDIEEVFLAEHRQAGYLSMRTDDLIEAERLRAIIQAKLEPDATDE